MLFTTRALAVAVILALAGVSTAARAADAPSASTKRHARDLFARGIALSKQNRWRDALVAFEQSDRLFPHARTTFNLGYCERGLGHWTRARKHFRAALAMDAASPQKRALSPAMKDAAKRYLRDAEASIGRIRVEVPAEGGKLSIDGRPVERVEPGRAVAGIREPGAPEALPGGAWVVDADAGRHAVRLAAPDGRFVDGPVDVAAKDEVVFAKRLPLPVPEPAAVPSPPRAVVPAPTPAPSPPDDTGQLVGAGVLGGVAVVGVVAGAALAVHAVSVHDDAAAACPASPFCPDDAAFELGNEARRFGNMATATFVVAGAAAVCSGVLLLTAPSVGIVGDRAKLRLGPGTVGLRGAF